MASIKQIHMINHHLLCSSQKGSTRTSTAFRRWAIQANIIGNNVSSGGNTRKRDGHIGGRAINCGIKHVTCDSTGCVAAVPITILGGIGIVSIPINKVMHTNEFVVTNKTCLVIGVTRVTNAKIIARSQWICVVITITGNISKGGMITIDACVQNSNNNAFPKGAHATGNACSTPDALSANPRGTCIRKDIFNCFAKYFLYAIERSNFCGFFWVHFHNDAIKSVLESLPHLYIAPQNISHRCGNISLYTF